MHGRERPPAAPTASPLGGRPTAACSRPSPKPAAKPSRQAAAAATGGGGVERRRRRPSAAAAGARSRPTTCGLMNCTRTGGWVTSTRQVQQPGRPRRRGAQARRGHQQQGVAARTPRSSPSAPTAATSSAATPAIGCAAPATRATAGPRTSAAARATRAARSSGSHLFFQTREVVQRRPLREPDERASTTGSGIGVWVSHGRVRLVIDFYHP